MPFIAILASIFGKCITADDNRMPEFCKAVDEGIMIKAVWLHQSSGKYSEERNEMLNYVVDTKDQSFIFKFAKQTRIKKYDLLAALHRKKSPKMIEEAFKVFKFSQEDLMWAASRLELMCSLDDLFNLLGKIEEQENQEEAIEHGTYNLFPERTECFEQLLDTLEGNESFKHLKNAAINGAFEGASIHDNKSIVERFYDHPAVTSGDYAHVLLVFRFRYAEDPIFTFLLGEADQDDLDAVVRIWEKWKKLKWEKYDELDAEFTKTIEDALLTAKPGGTRTAFPKKKTELVKENPSM